jgi:hypothetical protein
MMKRSWTLYFGIALLCSFALDASAGHETGHGGDSRASAFASTAHQILADLKEQPVNGIDTSKLEKAILKTSIRISDDVLIDVDSGKRVDAINHPNANPPEIVVERAAWDSILDPFEKRRLVLHEYLSISGQDDRRYQLSSRIDRANICSRSPAMRTALERAFGGSTCDRISSDDLLKMRSLEFREGETVKEISVADLAGMNLEELNVVLPDLCALEGKTASNLKRLTSGWLGRSTERCMSSSNFIGLKRLEVHRVGSLRAGSLAKLPKLEELVLVSDPAKPATIKTDAFTALRESPLRRLVLCDTEESGTTSYVRLPNFILDKNTLQGLSDLKEATLCLNVSSSARRSVDRQTLTGLASLTHLWLKVDELDALADDFFIELPRGAHIALVPAGRALEAKALTRFKELDCSKGWDWSKESSHHFVSGKTYCLRK